MTARLNLKFIKVIREKFGIKVFIVVAFFSFFMSISFTCFYVHHQVKFLNDTLVKDGKLLSGILAYNSRIGVFSENNSLLKDPVEAIFQCKGLLEVSIFNLEGNLLKEQQSPWIKKSENIGITHPQSKDKLFKQLKASKVSIYREGKKCFEFWSPVILGRDFSGSDSISLPTDAIRKEGRVIGFVQIILVKEILYRQIRELLVISIFIWIIFLMLGSAVSYVVVTWITKPLKKLTAEVDALGRGVAVEKVPVETEDEIGKLARAFNNMYESLHSRENALRESETRLRFLSSRLLNAQEQERKRVSKELHEELGQSLAHLKHRIRSIQRKFSANPDALSRECDSISRYIDLTIENVRRLSRDLRPAILEHLGLSAALRWLLDGFQKQYSIQTSIEIENIDAFFFPADHINVYRIFQEALTNIGKHAKARHVAFSVKKEMDYILFFIEDDGIGFDVAEAVSGNSTEKGMGLAIIHERAHMLGADLDISSQVDKGTKITLTVAKP